MRLRNGGDVMASSYSNGYDRAWQRLARTMYGKPCHYCGKRADTADHLIPISQGGTSTLDNVVPACRACNSGRSGRGRSNPRPWRRQ